MIYFFHHYELPAVLQQARVHQLMVYTQQRQHQQQNNTDNASEQTPANATEAPPNNTAGEQPASGVADPQPNGDVGEQQHDHAAGSQENNEPNTSTNNAEVRDQPSNNGTSAATANLPQPEVETTYSQPPSQEQEELKELIDKMNSTEPPSHSASRPGATAANVSDRSDNSCSNGPDVVYNNCTTSNKQHHAGPVVNCGPVNSTDCDFNACTSALANNSDTSRSGDSQSEVLNKGEESPQTHSVTAAGDTSNET